VRGDVAIAAPPIAASARPHAAGADERAQHRVPAAERVHQEIVRRAVSFAALVCCLSWSTTPFDCCARLRGGGGLVELLLGFSAALVESSNAPTRPSPSPSSTMP
jgi:hypothetical protein